MGKRATSLYDLFDKDYILIARFLNCHQIYDLTGINPADVGTYACTGQCKAGKYYIERSIDQEQLSDWDRTVRAFRLKAKKKLGGR